MNFMAAALLFIELMVGYWWLIIRENIPKNNIL